MPTARSSWRKIKIYSNYLVRFVKITAFVLFLGVCYLCCASSFRLALYERGCQRLCNLGFTLEELIVEGRKNTTEQELCSFVTYPKGTPIWRVDLDSILAKAKGGVWVKRCFVARKLPNAVCLTIVERVPIAIWQNNYKHYLIDSEGDVIEVGDAVSNFAYLPRVVGKGANVYAKGLLDDIAFDPELASKLETAVRCGERRWDIYLEGILIKMPQEDMLKAWKHLSALNNRKALFGRKIKSIDMRNADKFYVEYQTSDS
jgi:cell division protein FtsQ